MPTKTWKQVLIERLINQTYTYTRAGGIKLDTSGNHHPFANQGEHERWYYAEDKPQKPPYSNLGLKRFKKLSSQGGSYRRAVTEKVNHHDGAPMDKNSDAGSVHDAVSGSLDVVLFGDSSADEDVFMAVRKKIEHVYEEGVKAGGGECLAFLETIYSDLCAHIVNKYGGSGKPSVGQTDFEDMLAALDVYKKLADRLVAKGIPSDPGSIHQLHLSSKGPGANSHDTW